MGAINYLLKPVDEEELLDSVKRCVEELKKEKNKETVFDKQSAASEMLMEHIYEDLIFETSEKRTEELLQKLSRKEIGFPFQSAAVVNRVLHFHLDSVILGNPRLNDNHIIKMNHAVILAGHRQHRADDLHRLHLLIGESDLLHQIHARLFPPCDIVGMMNDAHLIRLVILGVMLIRPNLDLIHLFSIEFDFLL